ncbi:unnamed protein product [Linum tenue]|uniref:Uncharacterized protein n=1 Tax=Linum tenue TaxID=586396 RepID=A0AAV0MB87_9ROSI|nr:unnamed protein product [Linum tenue]
MPAAPLNSSSTSPVTLLSKRTVVPDQPSTIPDLKLSASDLPMLSCHYIQKGALFSRPSPSSSASLLLLLQSSLAHTLSLFPPLAGRLSTDPKTGHVYITCNDAGADFIHASAPRISATHILGSGRTPDFVNGFFSHDRTVSYHGHTLPLLAVQVTELADGAVFIGCSVNHAVCDGTSFWNFYNAFARVARGVKRIPCLPDFTRHGDNPLMSSAVLKLPRGGPRVTFDETAPFSERIFKFSREAVLKLKAVVNEKKDNAGWVGVGVGYGFDPVEMMGKQSNDPFYYSNSNQQKKLLSNGVVLEEKEISSFQSLCALVWRAVTRARNLSPTKTTTFRMAVNCRHRVEPKMDPMYFGNAIQSIPSHATAGDVASRGLRWLAERLNESVNAYDDAKVRSVVKDWEASPRCFPLGNLDGASMTMGSSPRFPMYDNDFGWGRPLAVRSGKANKFDGKMSAFPGREGGGTVDLEIVLAPETMAAIEADREFMQYVSR